MMAAKRCRMRQWHLGLRCRALVLMGAAWMLLGIGVATNASDPPDGIMFLLIPAWIRATVWIGSGLVALTAGLLQRGTSQAVGGLVVMPLIRFTAYAAGWVAYLIPGAQSFEFEQGWLVATVYLAMMGAVGIVSQIPAKFHPEGPGPRRWNE